MIIRHWALFIEGDRISWSFGIPDSDPEGLEFQQTTLGFIQSLQAIGRELYKGEGVASIKLANPTSRSTLMANEIFIVNLSDQFYFIISDLAVTARLIAIKGLPDDIEMLIRAVLVGQASILYSTLMMDEKKEGFVTDEIFKEIILALEVTKRGIAIEELVDTGRVSLSSLTMTELLLFHYLLRDYLESNRLNVSLSGQAWAIMVDSSGTDIPLTWQSPKDPYLLGNFLGAIYSYVQALFGTKPSAIVFGGGHELILLQFFGGKNYFLAASNPQALIRDSGFIQKLKQVPNNKFQDIEIVIKEFIIKQTLDRLADVLINKKYTNLIALFQNIDSTYFKWRELNLLDISGLGKQGKQFLESQGIDSLELFQQRDCDLLAQNLPTNSRISLKSLKKWQNDAKKLLEKTGGFEISISPAN